MATLKINAIRANLAHSAHKILGVAFVVICLAISATYADDNTSKSTQTTKAKSAQNGGGNAKPKSKKSKHSNLKATDSTNSKQSTSQSTTQSDKSPYLTLAPSSNPKTGGFIGGEFTIIISKASDTLVSGDAVYQSKTYSPEIAPIINIIGGYQWYFYNKPHFNLGFRFKAYLGYSPYLI